MKWWLDFTVIACSESNNKVAVVLYLSYCWHSDRKKAEEVDLVWCQVPLRHLNMNLKVYKMPKHCTGALQRFITLQYIREVNSTFTLFT